MSIGRVAVIYDDRIRPDTTGVYCFRALQKLTAAEHLLPETLGHVPQGKFDLFLNIDDGLDYRLPPICRPCAWWVIDTHLNLEWDLRKAPDFDCVFAAQRPGAEGLRAAGMSSARWLPLACDPEIHSRHEVPKTHDLCFVGHVLPGRRTELLELLQRHFPRMLVDQRFFAEMARAYSASKIVFNRSVRDDINMRVFEALSCGSMLLTNDLSAQGQAELFRDGVHLVTYRNEEELLDKARYYLSHDDIRERIAAVGRAEAVLKHTYRIRMERLLGEAEDQLSRTAVPVSAARSPTATAVVESSTTQGSDFGLTSIVILTHNQIDFTRGCIESIRRNTPEPFELVLVDNGSTDGTVSYLKGVPGATVILNPENRGFPAAANQGIAATRGRQVLLLNNDTVLPAGWLGRILRALHSDPRIGLVGPCSNFVSGEQQIAIDYRDLDGLEMFVATHAFHNTGRVEPTDRLVGFCLLMRREVIDQVGDLDERFGLGCFEDDDYCRRALAAGWNAVIAREAFVHHYGGRTFVGAGIDFAGLMRTNQAKFDQKWRNHSEPVPVPVITPTFSIRRAATDGLLLERDRITLSLIMIVRNNAATIAAALASIRPFVDEMIVIDTGSTDGTPEICARMGAKVFHFPWVDSFSAARNESIRHARGRWLFWMDSDDTIDPNCGQQLRDLAYTTADSKVMGFVVKVRCPGSDGRDVTVVDHVKLVRAHPEIRFEFRIHEQILMSIRRLGGDVAMTDLFVTHSGYDHSPEGQARKLERDLQLLRMDNEEHPNHPFVLFNLGMTYADAGRCAEAAEFLRRSIAVANPGESHVRKAYALLASAEDRQGKRELALAACAEGLNLFPLDAELRFRRGLLLHACGRLMEAAEAFEDLLARPDEAHFASVSDGIAGHLARHNLALVYEGLGYWSQAERQWRTVMDERPDHEPALHGRIGALRRLGKFGEATSLLSKQTGVRDV